MIKFRQLYKLSLFQAIRQNTPTINISSQNAQIILHKMKKFKEFHDNFGIQNMKSKEKLLDLFNSRRQKLTLNEQIKILQRISQLNSEQTYKTIYGIDSVIQKVQLRIQKLDFDEDIYLGCLIEGLQNLGYYQDSEIWVQICDSILHDRFEIEGAQIYKILKGLAFMKTQIKEEYKMDLMKKTLLKIRDIMSVVILDQQYLYQLEQLNEIANLFYQEHILDSQFIKLLDFNIYKIMSKNNDANGINSHLNEQTLSHLIDINFIFAIKSYYSQTVNEYLEQQDKQKLIELNVIKIIAITIFLKSHKNSRLDLDYLIETRLQNFDYSSLGLSELNILLQSVGQMNIKSQDEVIQVIDNIILDDSYNQHKDFTLDELKNTLMIRQYREDKLNKFAITASKSKLLVDEVIEFLEYINSENIEHLFTEFYNVLPKFLAENCNHYNWEQQCLLYYFMRKEQHLFSDFHYQNGHLNVLKEFIKLHYAQKSSVSKYIQPIPTTSNFYKILTVIDLAELFSDSHYS